MDTQINDFFNLLYSYIPTLLGAVLLLIVGLWVIKRVSGVLSKSLLKNKMDETLSKFLVSVIATALKILLLLAIAGQFGIETTSFVAILGALTVGIGMALNGSIGHLASGVMLMIFRPYKIGDLVTIGDQQTGKVTAINAFNTTLITLNNQKIIIANSNITANTITNISGQETIGVELVFGIAYTDDIDLAREIILKVGQANSKILKEPKQNVVVSELGDSSVNLMTRPFCNSGDYWDVYFYMNEEVKKAFDREGISIPFPQLDVYYRPQ
jgi:small conductance mechanosensitive channel